MCQLTHVDIIIVVVVDVLNVGFVDGSHLLAVLSFGIFESITGNSQRSLSGHNLQALHNSRSKLVYQSVVIITLD